MEVNPYRAPRFDVRAERDEALRMYGIDPQAALPAGGWVRSRLTTGNIIGQWIAFVLFGAGPFLLGLRVFRADPAMTNARESIEAAVTKMYERGKVVPEIIDFEETPLIRRLTLERR